MDSALPTSRLTTGLPALDAVLDGLRIGDNVVWRVDDVDDYARFVAPFVASAAASGRTIIYLRFASHEALLEASANIEVVTVDAERGFEAFTRRVYQLITEHGRGAFYVFDCLSDLLYAWATDAMIGNFFRVACPYLFDLDTVAYFSLLRGRHAHTTIDRIRQTTQVLLDVHHTGHELYVQPVKVWQRRSATMFLPHAVRGERIEPVVSSGDATALQSSLMRVDGGRAQRQMDFWDQLSLRAAEALEAPHAEQAATVDQLCRVMIGRDEAILALARRYFNVGDLIEVRARMVGTGFIGGKAVGMLLARQVLTADPKGPWRKRLEMHDSFYVGSDVYYSYLVHNGLWPLVMEQRTEAGYFEAARTLRTRMLAGAFPIEVRRDLENLLEYFGQYPILVRSSSLLEDGFGNAFAGKYESRFLVNQGGPEDRFHALEQAIREVFASTMSEDALTYRQQRGLKAAEEPMALLIQRVSGTYRGRYYMPDIAGVGVSRNTFAWSSDMDPRAGMLRLVIGLGTRAVDRIEGDYACVVALDEPMRRPFRDSEAAHRFSQHDVDVLDIDSNALRSVPVAELADPPLGLPLQWAGELDRETMRRLEERGRPQRVWRVSFAPLLTRSDFVPTMRQMLTALEAAYDYPVDVEFTASIDENGGTRINLVQCRPLQTLGSDRRVEVPPNLPLERVLFSTEGSFMGGSIDQAIARVIVVRADRYAALDTAQRYEVARLVGRLTRSGGDARTEPTLLLGPGRWGTSTPSLGVPVGFADIARVAVLVEVADMGSGLVPDLSFGSHFFQDLVETRIGYVALFPEDRKCIYRPQWLEGLRALPLPLDENTQSGAGAAVSVYCTGDRQLRLLADVRSQRVACFG